MTNIKKITSLVTTATLTAGILISAVPAAASASTSTKVVQAQNNLKKQIDSYIKSLNDLKSRIKKNDKDLNEYYTELQNQIPKFKQYGYSGTEDLIKKTASYKAKIDKTRKDNLAVDMKVVTTTFNKYISKVDSKNAKVYYALQKSKLLLILNSQDNLLYDMEDYVYEVESQIFDENEIFIRKQLPTEYANLETESTNFVKRNLDMMLKVQEINKRAYEVLEMDYTVKKQIDSDLNNIMEKFFDGIYGEEEEATEPFSESEDLYTAIENRDVVKAKIALLNATTQMKEFNIFLDQLIVELNEYKENLTVKFADKVKVAPVTE
jgi:hypothetical protein